MSKYMLRFVSILTGRSGAWSGQAGHPLRGALLAVSPPGCTSPERPGIPGLLMRTATYPVSGTRATPGAVRW